MPINESGVDYFPGGSTITIGAQNQSLNLLNLGILNVTNAGTGGSYATSLIRNDTEDNNLNIGESFTMSRTPNPGNILGTPQTLQLNMVGTGNFTGALVGTRQIIIAETAGGARYVIFPNGDAPTGLGGVGGAVLATFSTDDVGYNFDTNAPLCFTRGTMLETPTGQRAIEDLLVGDLVLTKDSGPQPIRWIRSRVFSPQALQRNPNIYPILIRAGALGEGIPASDLIVSPQHRILLRSRVAQRMFGTVEVLVAAKQLLQVKGIDICIPQEDDIEYFHMLFDRHEVVFANGAEAETLFTGPEAIKSIGAAALEEIYEIFPELRRGGEPEGARLLLSGRKGRKLVSRHVQHQRPLVAASQRV